MRGGLCPTRINEVLKTQNIALDIGTRVFQRVPNPRLCREVYHVVKIVLCEERVNDRTVSQVTLHKRKPGVLE